MTINFENLMKSASLGIHSNKLENGLSKIGKSEIQAKDKEDKIVMSGD